MSDIQQSIPISPESISTSAPSQASGGGVHASVQAHLEKEHTTRCGPQGEAHYSRWDPADHTQHKKYDEIYHKMDDQDPHDAERYEHIMHSPHVSTEAKLNAVDAMELPHTDQRCDLGLREPDHPEQRDKEFFRSISSVSFWPFLSSTKQEPVLEKWWIKEKWFNPNFISVSSTSSKITRVGAVEGKDEGVIDGIEGRKEEIGSESLGERLKWVWVDD
ncbi:hypothetical protein JCM3765_005452 [Sporobolomyces pararoseus]